VSEELLGKQVRVPVDFTLKAHTWLLDGAGVPNCGCSTSQWVYAAGVQHAKMEILVISETRGCKRAGGVYISVAQDARMEILDKI
jgi:hypothetical protein